MLSVCRLYAPTLLPGEAPEQRASYGVPALADVRPTTDEKQPAIRGDSGLDVQQLCHSIVNSGHLETVVFEHAIDDGRRICAAVVSRAGEIDAIYQHGHVDGAAALCAVAIHTDGR